MTPVFEIKDLQRLTVRVAEDLLARSQELSDVDQKLRGAWREARDSGRTAASFEAWRDDWVDQVAVAWVLGCVFVRYLEDNGLVEDCWLAGEGARGARAEEAQEGFFREQPELSDREYLEHVFRVVGAHPATRELFAEGRTPIWDLGPSGDGAMALLKFWREVDPETGRLRRSFSGEDGDTRFLGDLYQELSEAAKKKYALLQTPDFVEAFILDHTLDPALEEFGLETVRMIDPTCGSGHFLLGAFHRLFERWQKQEPGGNPVVLAQRALDAVHGVDVNPFAVAIARFRLILAAMHVCGIRRLAEAPGWKLNLAVGDSLLHGAAWDPKGEQIGRGKDWFGETEDEVFAEPALALEDSKVVRRILGQPYHAVVGNPPYITVKDKALNQLYRERYSACHRKYALVVPFVERFFRLCVTDGGERVGHVGMIVANSFMKREFGKKLIEELLPSVELETIIDTSGAYIPGHGTPTVILFGRNRTPVSLSVRAVLGIRGEPKTPDDPAKGLVWSAILEQLDKPGSESEFVSVADLERDDLASHPWALTGGGALELKERIEAAADSKLGDHVVSIGFGAILGEDEAFLFPPGHWQLDSIPEGMHRPLVTGEEVRDWSLESSAEAIFPYSPQIELQHEPSIQRKLWRLRSTLEGRRDFSKRSYKECGRPYWEYHQIPPDRYRTPLSIAFAFVATHNHFVLDRGGKVFNRSAPVIKLPPDATEDDHLALLGLLNSSVACFWMKQVFFPKGGDQVGQSGARVRKNLWEERFEFAGTQLEKFPLPNDLRGALERVRELDRLAREELNLHPNQLVFDERVSRERLDQARKQSSALRAKMVFLQEELDWESYRLHGLLTDDEAGLLTVQQVLPELQLGQRAFEIVLAQKVKDGSEEAEWFNRHGSTAVTVVPDELPTSYRDVLQRRVDRILNDADIALVESREHKRRWNWPSWDDGEKRALKEALVTCLEEPTFWPRGGSGSELRSVSGIAEMAGDHPRITKLGELYRGRSDFDLGALVGEIVQAQSVPFLSILRYKAPGLRKREVWERTWELQRAEDRGDSVGDIPVPPKYKSSDFLKQDYWRLRGKLDVPKERFISFPHCERDGDPTLVVLWAGYDQLQQAQAIAAYYERMKSQEGWSPERLQPLLAGLDQLVPWLLQWHNELDPEYQLRMGDYFKTFLETEARELGFTLEEVRGWLPVKGKR